MAFYQFKCLERYTYYYTPWTHFSYSFFTYLNKLAMLYPPAYMKVFSLCRRMCICLLSHLCRFWFVSVSQLHKSLHFPKLGKTQNFSSYPVFCRNEASYMKRFAVYGMMNICTLFHKNKFLFCNYVCIYFGALLLHKLTFIIVYFRRAS